jgi:hypothetical protein
MAAMAFAASNDAAAAKADHQFAFLRLFDPLLHRGKFRLAGYRKTPVAALTPQIVKNFQQRPGALSHRVPSRPSARAEFFGQLRQPPAACPRQKRCARRWRIQSAKSLYGATTQSSLL